MSDAEVEFSVSNGVGRIHLNRPKALNALTLSKIRLIAPQLDAWAADDAVHAVAITGEGTKAFCAGGDIRAIHDAIRGGDSAFLAAFFAEEYRLNRRIKTYPKPYVAIMDGITMGGGVGVSVHGTYRVATENTVFAMPETGIGFFPDVGGTYFLPRCPGALGTFLGLSGARLNAADALYAGVVTHHVPSHAIPSLLQALGEAERDLSDVGDYHSAMTTVLDMYHEDPGHSALEERQEMIDRCFGQASVEEILDALKDEDAVWAAEQYAVLAEKSPMALKVACRQLQVGRHVDFDRAMQIEYRLSQRFCQGHDFPEGIRATIIERGTTPEWSPAGLDTVDAAAVDGCFAPLPEGDLAFD
ncbi:enoyl-CoA hydratase/isomerase family protein [Roseospirillum parvum]|uniref:3-hydroxyisobutyryl-CoA hydrolase n=1 Tax=Roseospirillum parvum TaxID=83401 RepID=A0A1G7Y4L4_9PROT|nr:enoyl-CoA hydratase/isomerase family protein [Roseospirillum parvum]SDG91381.1 enoyl-CoA hydratase [Roseospirillum parvum]